MVKHGEEGEGGFNKSIVPTVDVVADTMEVKKHVKAMPHATPRCFIHLPNNTLNTLQVMPSMEVLKGPCMPVFELVLGSSRFLNH